MNTTTFRAIGSNMKQQQKRKRFLILSLLVASAFSGPLWADEVVEQINEWVAQDWRDHEISPSRSAPDGKWCRRVYVDILGRTPSYDEVQKFVQNRHPQKRAQLVDALLGDQYGAEYARRWATVWTNVLVGRTGGNERNSLINRDGMYEYLRASFQSNKSYDALVRELLVATGSNRPGSADFDGAVNFLTMKLNDRGIQATTRSAEVFLGVRVQCTQCHNHPFNDWKQNQFWELNAFFRQARPLRRFRDGTRDISHVELVDQDYRGEGRNPEEAEVYYEQRNGILKAAYPVFVDGSPLQNRSGFVDDVNRRQALADFTLDSPQLALAIVNRYWSYFLGYGFVMPIDDLGPHNPASHPELHEFLAQRLRDDNFDLKKMIRWITLSDTYALSSRAGSKNKADDPQLGYTPHFSRFYARQMRPEELYESMMRGSYRSFDNDDRAQHRPERGRWLRQFTRALGNDQGDESTTFNGTIPQTLMMFNGPLVDRALRTEEGSLLGDLLRDNTLSDRQRVQYLYWTAFGRAATKRELRVAEQLFAQSAATVGSSSREWQDKKPPQAYALQDIYWALLNSNEYILNH